MLSILVAAFLGGLILNVMPCVLPVLTMKVFHLLEHADESASVHRKHAVAYTAGVLSTFGIFALAVLVLKASGELVGWGMHFQDPTFVAVLVAVMVVLGLNALGVFEFQVSLQGHTGTGGYRGSFLNGVVASVMATPCSAPFLGTAAVAAMGAGVPAWQTVVIFGMIGIGLASPFVLVSFVPALARLLPRPGAWMESFKHLMGFSLLLAAVWFGGTLQKQVDAASFQRFLFLLVFIGMAGWAIGRFAGPMANATRRLVVQGIATAAILALGVGYVNLSPSRALVCADGQNLAPVVDNRINWQPFSSALVQQMREVGRPVFVDYTADWCQNCKANEALFIEVERTRQVLIETNILPMKADMTNDEPEILRWLSELGRSGIPAYTIYFPDGTYDLLPVAITTELLVERLEAAAARFPQ